MDPLSAIGVAAAAVQFLQVGLQTLNLCREIRDNTDGATDANRQLESYSQTLRDLVKDLRASSTNGGAAGRRVTKIAHDCIAASEELTNVVSEVRKAGKATSLAAAKATYRALRERKRIEKLRNALEQHQKLLDSALLHDIRHRVDIVSIEQNKDFASLKTTTKDLVAKLMSQELTACQRHADLRDAVSVIESQNATLQQDRATRSGQSEIRQDVARLHSDLSAELEGFSFKSKKDELLTSLFYPDLDTRKDMLKPPWEQTFDWIFDEFLPTGFVYPHFRADHEWPSFPRWLMSDSSVYWISGRAGSGKSTLMRHIAEDERTKKHLDTWAGQHRLYTFSFFFWRPGSQLQKSVRGLLRSLLYQIMGSIDGVADAVMTEHGLLPGRFPDWTEQRLVRMTRTAFATARDDRICLLVDGLDEFEGVADDLLDLLRDMHDLPNVKVCLSSRPEVQLNSRLSSEQRLRLEHFNGPAIETYAQEKLSMVENGPHYAQRIKEQSNGIFLWAVLVVQSLIRGHHTGDDNALMESRLAQSPTEIDDLFRHMLAGVERVHLKTLWWFLRIMRHTAERSVALVTATILPHDIESYSIFAGQCARTAKQIRAQSQGLLEADTDDIIPFIEGDIWLAEHLEYSHDSNSKSCLVHDKQSVASSMRPVDKSEVADKVLQWQCRKVHWIHRSAQDYIINNDIESLLGIDNIPNEAETSLALVEGHSRLLVAGLYNSKSPGDGVEHHVWLCFHHIQAVLDAAGTTTGYKDRAYSLLDELRDLLLILQRQGIRLSTIQRSTMPEHSLSLRPDNELHFWDLACFHGLHEYITRSCAGITQHDDDGIVLSHIINDLCARVHADSDTVPESAHHEAIMVCIIKVLEQLLDKWTLPSPLPTDAHKELMYCRALACRDRASRCDITWISDARSKHVSTFVHAWVQFSDKFHVACKSTPISTHVTKILSLFQCILRSREVHLGSTINFKPGRLSLQTSASAVLHTRLQKSSTDAILDQLTAGGVDLTPTYRIVCQKGCKRTLSKSSVKSKGHGLIGEEILYNITSDLAVKVRGFEQYRDDALERYLDDSAYVDQEWLLRCDAFRNALVADIWANEDGQLNAWQQLYLLACIRVGSHKSIFSRAMWAHYLSVKAK